MSSQPRQIGVQFESELPQHEAQDIVANVIRDVRERAVLLDIKVPERIQFGGDCSGNAYIHYNSIAMRDLIVTVVNDRNHARVVRIGGTYNWCNKGQPWLKVLPRNINKFECPNPGRDFWETIVVDVDCPMCENSKGFYCTTFGGRKILQPHSEREHAYSRKHTKR